MIQITEVLFQDEYSGLESGNGSDAGQVQLKGTIMDLLWVKISAELGWSTLCTSMTFDSALQTITRTDCNGGGSFITDGFEPGNEIIITGTGDSGYGYYDNLSFVITDVTDAKITVSAGIIISGSWKCVSIYGVPDTSNAALDFYYNLVGTNQQPAYNSLTDVASVQKFTGNMTTGNLMQNATSWAWWDGYLGSNGYGGQSALVPALDVSEITGDFKIPFVITFPFLVSPFLEAQDLQMLKDAFTSAVYNNSGTAKINTQTAGFQVPVTFKDGSTLKFISRIDYRNDKALNTINHTSDPYTWNVGNVSWYNMPFPSSAERAKYYLYPDGITYTIGATAVSAIDYKQVTDVKIQILSSGLFTNGDKYVLNFVWVPTNASAYQNYQASSNPATFRNVFMHDRAYTTVGASGVNGDQYGTDWQVLKNVIGVVNGITGTLDITFSVVFSAALKEIFDSLDPSDRNYMFVATPQEQTEITLSESTRNSVICDVNLATVNTDEPGLFSIITDGTADVHYFRFPDVNIHPVTNYAGAVGEFAYSKTQFKVLSGCKLENINQGFQVTVYNPSMNVAGTFFIEQWNKDVSGFWNGISSDISINEGRGYPLSENDIRNTRSINRKASLDGGGFFAYEIIYGFQLGYQFWQNLDIYAKEFGQYHTQYWPVYSQSDTLPSGYTSSIKFVQQWTISNVETGNITNYIHTSNVSAADVPPGTITVDITTQDSAGNDLDGVVAEDVETQVTALYSGNGHPLAPVAPYTDYIAEMTFFYDNGNGQTYDTVTTEEDQLSISLWLGRPVITVINDQMISVVCITDASVLEVPIKVQRIITRLGYKI